MNALAMVTEAGVKSNKLMVGIASYGRSFKMSDPDCSSQSDTYLSERKKSPARPGECTNEGGYIADAKILKIMEDGVWPYNDCYDEASDSNILTYKNTEWVCWMSATVKSRRVDRYKSLNFAGASD